MPTGRTLRDPAFPIRAVVGALLAACGGGSKPASQPEPQAVRPIERVHPLATPALAGEQIPVVPLTILLPEDTLQQRPEFSEQRVALRWADSIITGQLIARGPEVNWVPPGELRKIARRSPGVAVDPDQMGQGIMRIRKLDEVPDPLRSYLRSLAALAGGRHVMIPATLEFLPSPDGQVRAELWMVLADVRTGMVVWRSMATGFGPAPASALVSAMRGILPLGPGGP